MKNINQYMKEAQQLPSTRNMKKTKATSKSRYLKLIIKSSMEKRHITYTLKAFFNNIL